MAEDEVIMEVEAVEAVYGDDCIVLEKYPPHLHVHIKPRTAEVSSQQFVEAVLGIQAGPQYPDNPPHIIIVDSKGLDEERQKHLISSVHDKACELSSYLMLVTLCEEAVESLSSMNHPDGSCPLCLSPLVQEDAGSDTLPFMKLMSCFHCFHRECIIRWWNWLQMEKETHPKTTSGPNLFSDEMEDQQRMLGEMGGNVGQCPVCRKGFQVKDIEHVLDLVGNYSQLGLNETEVNDDEELLHSDSENIRRQKFEAILKIQQENCGLIEPKKSEVLQPGMFLPRPITSPSTKSATETSEKEHRNRVADSETKSRGSSNRPSTSQHKNSGTRKQQRRGQDSRRQVKQWIRKENDATN